VWWFSAIVGVFILSLWLGFFINKRDIFSWARLNVLYKTISSATDTARFLRAGVGMGIVIFIVIFDQILKNFFKKPVSFTRSDIKKIVNFSDYTYSFNALAGDKSYILNDKKSAFIMYAKSKDSWIALGDPIGIHGDKDELLWKFKEIADNASAKLAFIGVDHTYVQIYSDIGLDTFSIGREAKVLLKTFDKEKERFKYFCCIEEEIEHAGFNYKTVSASQFGRYKDIFAQINKDWGKNTNYLDRNFIPGRYDESYMKDMDFGILEKDGGIYAFSVIAKTKNKHEVSSGVVRYIKCDKDIFTYIIFKNILWAKENGYKWFDLGLAYFPALDSENEVIKHFAKMFMFAEHFNYNIVSLMKFKDRFCPIWRNKYIAVHTAEYIITFIKNFVTLVFPPEIINSRHLLIRSFKK
jgi:phosphatidylglycerol lysyltransferase